MLIKPVDFLVSKHMLFELCGKGLGSIEGLSMGTPRSGTHRVLPINDHRPIFWPALDLMSSEDLPDSHTYTDPMISQTT